MAMMYCTCAKRSLIEAKVLADKGCSIGGLLPPAVFGSLGKIRLPLFLATTTALVPQLSCEPL